MLPLFKERACLFMEEIVRSAAAQRRSGGLLRGLAKYPERNGDGIALD